MSDPATSGPGPPPDERPAPEAHASGPRPDPLRDLAPAARRAVIEQFLADAHARLRDLLSAAATQDRDTVARIASGLATDARAVGLSAPQQAALDLARAAATDAPLGAPVLALTRALAEAEPPT